MGHIFSYICMHDYMHTCWRGERRTNHWLWAILRQLFKWSISAGGINVRLQPGSHVVGRVDRHGVQVPFCPVGRVYWRLRLVWATWTARSTTSVARDMKGTFNLSKKKHESVTNSFCRMNIEDRSQFIYIYIIYIFIIYTYIWADFLPSPAFYCALQPSQESVQSEMLGIVLYKISGSFEKHVRVCCVPIPRHKSHRPHFRPQQTLGSTMVRSAMNISFAEHVDVKSGALPLCWSCLAWGIELSPFWWSDLRCLRVGVQKHGGAHISR